MKNILYIIFIQIYFVNSQFHCLEFRTKNYIAGHFAFNLNGDMIIQYSNKKHRLFYGLKQNGKGFFKDKNNETSILIDSVSEDYDSYNRYGSKNIFVSLKNESNTQFLLSVAENNMVEIFKFGHTNRYEIKKNNEFFGFSFYSNSFSLIYLEKSNDYIIIYLSSNKNVVIQKFSFLSFSLSASNNIVSETIPINLNVKTVSGFIIDEKIIVFYLNSITHTNDNSFKTILGNTFGFIGRSFGGWVDKITGTSASSITLYIYYINIT